VFSWFARLHKQYQIKDSNFLKESNNIPTAISNGSYGKTMTNEVQQGQIVCIQVARMATQSQTNDFKAKYVYTNMALGFGEAG
jgi:hypothetical protein